MSDLSYVQNKWKAFERLSGNEEKVVLMGDSVLDNFYWLVDRKRSLRLVVEERLRASYTEPTPICMNLAVDQMTTFDFLNRGKENTWRGYQMVRRNVYDANDDPLDHDGYEHLVGKDGRIRSADNLSLLKNVKHVVVSCGGNDVYLNADTQRKLFGSLNPFNDKRAEIAEGMAGRLGAALEEVQKAAPNARITLVICYHPHYEFNLIRARGWRGTVVNILQRGLLSYLISPAVRAMLELARVKGCDVIDLSQTLDPRDETHYGSMDTKRAGWSGAEPSDVSQEFIASLIMDVKKHRDADPDAPPRCYFGKTNGREYVETRAVEITEKNIWWYGFQSGFSFTSSAAVTSA